MAEAEKINSLAAGIIGLFFLIGICSFFAYLPNLFYSPQDLFSQTYTPEQWLASEVGPQELVLLEISKLTPDWSTVCLPETFYKTVFFKGDYGYYRFFWLKRKAISGDSPNCQYDVNLKGDIHQPDFKVEVTKR